MIQNLQLISLDKEKILYKKVFLEVGSFDVFFSLKHLNNQLEHPHMALSNLQLIFGFTFKFIHSLETNETISSSHWTSLFT